MSQPVVGGGRQNPDGEALLLGDRTHDVPHRLQHLGHREWSGLLIHQPVPVARQFDQVAGERRQPQGGAVNQAELAVLDLVDLPALAPLQGLGEKQHRGERGAQVVGHIDEQLQAVRAGQALGEILTPVGLCELAHHLHRLQQMQPLLRGDRVVIDDALPQ